MKIPDIFFAEGEEWREIKDYENLYWISNLGRVLSKRGRVFKIKKLQLNKTGYYHIMLCKNYIKKDFLVHRLVVSHFIGDFYENNNSTNHKNCVRTDNRVENLEICSYAYNNKYAYKHGNKKKERKVVQLDKLGNLIEIFDSYKLAESKIGKRGVLDVCRNRIYRLTCGGYKWMYYEDYINKVRQNQN